MGDSKIKYLKILKEQYNKGYITHRHYRKECRKARGEKTFIENLINFYYKACYK